MLNKSVKEFAKVKYCSKKCANEALTNKRPRCKTGKIDKCVVCGNKFYRHKYNKNKKYCSIKCKSIDMIGRKSSEFTRTKSSKSHKGDKSYLWKGGLTEKNKSIRNSIEYRLWREAVFARDNWTCQRYRIKGGKLAPHHIQNFSQYPELRFAIDNGITLSDTAHQAFHNKYGRKNNTREQLIEFLNN